MSLVSIEFDPPGYTPAEQFDFLGLKAAEALAGLFPGVRVILRYKKAEEDPHIPGVTKVEHQLLHEPGIVGDSFEPVLGHRGWWRQLTLLMNEENRHFLGIGSDDLVPIISVPPLSPGHGWAPSGTKTFRRNMPLELKYALSISEDVARAWSMHVEPNALAETKTALATQLPLWIVSHIAADKCYGFGTCGSGQRKHDRLAQTVTETIAYLESLACSRVEHQELSHGVIIAPSSKTNKALKTGAYPDDFRRLKRTPLLVDGVHSALWISPGGDPIQWITAESLRKARKCPAIARNPFGPLSLLAVASKSLRGIALGLSPDGSIVIFAKGRPLFVRRSGTWRGMMWSTVRETIDKKYGEIGTVIFDAALLLATTGHGGVIGIVASPPDGLHEKDRVDIAREKVYSFDPELLYSLTTDEYVVAQLPRELKGTHPEWLFHALLPDDQVTSLGCSMVATIAAIDGATVIDKNGKILAYGAVIPSHPCRSEGARSAAARELSEHGFVVKVSADGPITLYEGGMQLLEV